MELKLNRVTIDGMTVDTTWRGVDHCSSDVVVDVMLPLSPDLVDQLDEAAFIRGDLDVWTQKYTEWRTAYDDALAKFEAWWSDILAEHQRLVAKAREADDIEPPDPKKPDFNGPDQPEPVPSTRKITSLKGRYINAVLFETAADHSLVEVGKLRGDIHGTPKCVVDGARAHLELKIRRNVERVDREALADLVGHYDLQASDAQLSLGLVDAFDMLVQVFAPYWGERTARDIGRALAGSDHRVAVVDAIIQAAERTPAKKRFEYTLPNGVKLSLQGVGTEDEPEPDDGTQPSLPFEPPALDAVEKPDTATRPAFPTGLYGVLDALKLGPGTTSEIVERMTPPGGEPEVVDLSLRARVGKALQALVGLGFARIDESTEGAPRWAPAEATR